MPHRAGIGIGLMLAILAAFMFAHEANYLLILAAAAGAVWMLAEGIFGDN